MGIDLAWSPRNPSGVAFLVDDTIVYVGVVTSLADIVALVTKYAPLIVGVDAPLTVLNQTGNRLAEQELNKVFRRFDAGCYPANRELLGKYNGGTPRGEELVLLLPEYDENASSQAIIEVYPHAAQIRYFSRDKILKYKKDSSLLETYASLLRKKVSFTLPAASKKSTEDMLDAIMCALVAQSYAKGEIETFGGHIVVPQSLSSVSEK